MSTSGQYGRKRPARADASRLATRLIYSFPVSAHFTGRTALLLGCNDGFDSAFLAGLRIDVTTVDDDPEKLARGIELRDAKGISTPTCQFIEVDFRDLTDFGTDYDFVVANQVIDRFPKDEQAGLLDSFRRHTSRYGANAVSAAVESPAVTDDELRSQLVGPREIRENYRNASWPVRPDVTSLGRLSVGEGLVVPVHISNVIATHP